MNLIDALNWRYATKRMTGEPVPQEKVDIVLEAARLAPTSSNIQPFSIIQITDKTLLEKLSPIAFNQPQITKASHVLVFASWTDVTAEHIDKVYGRMASSRPDAFDTQTSYIQRLKDRLASLTPEARASFAARQTYIALGVAISAAALERIDATPMEGFNNDALDELLGLKEKGLHSMALLTIGQRDLENDWLVKHPKVRRPKEELVIEL